MRELHGPGRSAAYASTACIATSHQLASSTGLKVLREGGNAVDAAVAACAVLCVVEPHMTGIGGDNFTLFLPKGASKPIALNGSGVAPAKAELGWFLENGFSEIPLTSPHSVTVPGAVASWAKLLDRFGSKSIGELLQPAIQLAEDGAPISPRVHFDWSLQEEKLAAHPVSKEMMLVNGKAPALGSRHKQPKLAATFRQIAEKGRDGFYTGAVAEDIVGHLKSLGGLHELDDFANFDVEFVEPISTNYRGYDIFECPPNGQGICALMILNILQRHDMASLSEVERVHLIAEATKIAYGQRNRYVADPRQQPVPVDWLLSEAHASEMDALIDPENAGNFEVGKFPTHRDTIYLSCVDAEGNAISFINSIFHDFGSGIMAPESGVMLQNRGNAFYLIENHPNAIAPGKRPMHTIIPAMAMKDGQLAGSFGVMGGQYQSTGQANFLVNLLDRGLDPQQAMDDPRSFATDGLLQVEKFFDAETYEGLKSRGHLLEHMVKPLGGSQAVWVDQASGTLIGGTDPRKDGCAIGF